MALYLYDGKLLVKNGALSTAQTCCCGAGCTNDSQCPGSCNVCCGGVCRQITVAFSINAYTVQEGTSVTLFSSTTTSCIPAGAVVGVYVQNGTTNSSDFSGATSGTRTITSTGRLSSSFTVTVRNDGAIEPDEFFRFCIQYDACVVCSDFIGILAPRGACCWANYSLCESNVTQYDCLFFYQGDWQGVNTTCGSNACTLGACCTGTTCTQTTRTKCFANGGSSWRAGSCSPNPCVSPCTATTTSWSYANPNTNLVGPSTGCYDPNFTYGYQTLTRGEPYWPSGCNCVSISGGVDDIFLINGSPVGLVNGLCQGANSINHSFNTTANSFTIGVADTKGGQTNYNVVIEFHNRCGAFTAMPDAQPAAAIQSAESESPPPEEGPGTELKALLSKVGITSTPTCSCNARAAEMNRQGVQWCKDNEELILDWLKEEAENRNLPFVKLGAKMLLRLAIRNAEKKASQPPKDE